MVFVKRILTTFGLIALSVSVESHADVLTQRYNAQRTGSISGTGLDQNTVRNPKWGQVGTLNVKGTVYFQPLVVQRFQTVAARNGADLVFLATAQNWIYAFEAHSFAPLWPANPTGVFLGQNDKSTTGHPGCDGISGAEGIGTETTPVIDRGRGVAFVSYRVNRSPTNPAAAVQRLRAVDLRSGASLGDVSVVPPGAPDDWVVWHRSRAGLLL
jgi:hypothetical protein